MQCHVCKNERLVKFLSLGDQPPSDAFLRKEDLDKEEKKFPLDVLFCPECTLVQLGYAVDPDLLFRDYVYNTGSNNALKKNFYDLVERIVTRFALQKDDLVIDIGSNDGTLLANYLPHEIRVLGIDPSSSALLAKQKNVPTLNNYFNNETAEHVLSVHGKTKIITATNVFAHVDALDSLMQGVIALLAPEGVFISENGYVVDMVEKMQFDSIYHEHLRYYSVTALVHLFERYGMEVIDIEHIESHGGSIRVFAAFKGALSISPRVNDFLESEKSKGFDSLDTYRAFADRVAATKVSLRNIIDDLKESGARIVGIGAPAKGNTLLNYCELGTDSIEYLAERSPLKIGLFSPGMHIPVIDEQEMFMSQPDAALLLSWNLADELIPKIKAVGFRGKFVLPNPVPKIV